jgi:endonuclease G
VSARRKKKTNGSRSRSRRHSRNAGVLLFVLATLYSAAAVWYVHHPRRWLRQKEECWPAIVTAPLLSVGNALGDLTDALALTGHDAVYEYDTEPPAGCVHFAGAPRRTGAPAPTDIVTLARGDFAIGWSASLRHPGWCAYHVTPRAVHQAGERPKFRRDPSVPSAPRPGDYERSGYDRGHMAPNYAIVTRYGEAAQKQTFLMSNIAPQSPALNRSVWRNLEHRIADLWTARYGEIWVIVGALSSSGNRETVSGTDIDVPDAYYQIVVAQEGMNVRAFAVLIEQTVPWRAYAVRHLISIDELEEMTGLDFLPDLPDFIHRPLESELPSRLWPVRVRDIFRLLALRVS